MYSLVIVEIGVRLQSQLDPMTSLKIRILVMIFPDIAMELSDISKSEYYDIIYLGETF